MKNDVAVVRNLLLVAALLATPVLGQDLDLSKYNTEAGPNGVPPAFSANTPLADGRPGQYYFNVGAYAFTHHDYAFAVQMYVISASWAYKPAEYNLATMYALGQGTPIDLPRAMAWMTLAAERRNPKYLKAESLIKANLRPGDADAADAILKELKPRYGDESAMRRAKNRWAQVQTGTTGSLTGHPIGPLKVSSPDGTYTDGSLAYQGFMASDNPYNTPTVSVGALTPVQADDAHASEKPGPNAASDSSH